MAAIGAVPATSVFTGSAFRGIGKALGALGFGGLYAAGTNMGFNSSNNFFGWGNNRSKYYGRPSYFKLPYYRYRSSRFRRRYGRRYRKRYGYGRKRFFRSYRARRYY